MPRKNKYKKKRKKGNLSYKNLVRRAQEGLPEYEVKIETASRSLANRLVGVAQRSKKASEIELEIDFI